MLIPNQYQQQKQSLLIDSNPFKGLAGDSAVGADHVGLGTGKETGNEIALEEAISNSKIDTSEQFLSESSSQSGTLTQEQDESRLKP